MSTTTESPAELSSLTLRYRALATILLAESLELWSKLKLQPDGSTGQLELKLQQIICALRNETFRPITQAERARNAASEKLVDLAEKVLNDQKNGLVTESSAELAALLRSLR